MFVSSKVEKEIIILYAFLKLYFVQLQILHGPAVTVE